MNKLRDLDVYHCLLGFNPRNVASLHYNNYYLNINNTHIFIVLHGESFDWGHLVRKRWSWEKKGSTHEYNALTQLPQL